MTELDRELPEGYKMTELGPLPEEWEVVRLGEVFNVQQGKQLSSKESKDGKIKRPFLRTSNLSWGYVNISKIDEMYFTPQEYEKLRLKSGDVLVCEGGDIGRTALYRGELEECAYQNHLHRLRPKRDNIEVEFFVFWMDHAINQRQLYTYTANRTTIPNLSGSRLKSFIFPLPPLPEQRKIAAILSTVQEAKEKTEAVISAAKSLKKSMMSYLFTYGPVPLSDAENVPQKETEIGMIPEEWEVVKLGDVADFKNGINFTANQKGDKGILTVDVLNMYGESIYVSLNNLYRVNKVIDKDYLLKEGDLLFVRSSLKREGIGWTSLFKPKDEPVTFCGFIIRARLKDKSILPEYITNYMRTDTARTNLVSSSGKVAITNINQGMLGNIKISLPPLPEQRKIASMLSAIDEKIEAEENKKKALEDLFNTLLHNLMTARIRVNHLALDKAELAM